jgi:transposase
MPTQPERRIFTREYKLEVIKRSYDDIKISDLARELGIGQSIIHRWRRQFASDTKASFPGRGVEQLSDQEFELARLRKQVANLENERDILKKAVGIFSKPQL